MQLLKIEAYEYPIWYFATINDCAAYFGCEPYEISDCIATGEEYEGHFFEWANAADVIREYINPNDRGIRFRDYKNKSN
jgi:hypothetical protein